jgi:hypothetical protein
MSREHHFEHVVNGGSGGGEPTGRGVEQGAGSEIGCCADYSAPSVQIAVQQASAPDGTESHETTEPASTTRVAAGSSEVTPFTGNGEMAGAGHEQPACHAGNPAVATACDAILADRVELLARAVVLVAGMAIPKAAQKAVLARVVTELSRRVGQGATPRPG